VSSHRGKAGTVSAVSSLDEYRRRRQHRELFTYEELSARLGRSVRQLQRDKATGMPVALDFGRLLFDEGASRAWLERAV
jgi:predicted DNA-binding transcriptional regulator YafY